MKKILQVINLFIFNLSINIINYYIDQYIAKFSEPVGLTKNQPLLFTSELLDIINKKQHDFLHMIDVYFACKHFFNLTRKCLMKKWYRNYLCAFIFDEIISSSDFMSDEKMKTNINNNLFIKN